MSDFVASGEQAPVVGPDLSDAAVEFIRARNALEDALSSDSPASPLAYYRLRDVALATFDLCYALLRATGADVPRQQSAIRDGMEAIVGDDQAILNALDVLSGLSNAHVLGFMQRPSERRLHAGQAAGLVVAAFLDVLAGDGYLPRGD